MCPTDNYKIGAKYKMKIFGSSTVTKCLLFHDVVEELFAGGKQSGIVVLAGDVRHAGIKIPCPDGVSHGFGLLTDRLVRLSVVNRKRLGMVTRKQR